MGCGAIRFFSTTTNSKHCNLTFHSGCNVLYHPSISSITPLIWFSFIHIHSFPKTPNPIFHFFFISFETPVSVSTKTQSDARKAHMQRHKQSNEVLCFFFSSTILFHLLSLYGLNSLTYFHIVQLFFLVFFWYNILLFDSLLLFCGDDVAIVVVGKQNSTSWIPFFKVRSCYLIFFPSCLPSFPFV